VRCARGIQRQTVPGVVSTNPPNRQTKSILMVEDETDLAGTVIFHLHRAGYEYRAIDNGLDALAEVQRRPPDVLILDRMLPKLSGDEVVMRLRSDPRTARAHHHAGRLGPCLPAQHPDPRPRGRNLRMRWP
jgi:CheY-like chemotaxis protein